MEIIKTRGGRTGKKIHFAVNGSSSALCGKWFKASVGFFKVSDTTEVTCEKCQQCQARYTERP